MRGPDEDKGSPFSYVDLEQRIPARHPLRKIRSVVNDALRSLDCDFDRLYAGEGPPCIAPERLIRASLLQILYSIRSERQHMEQMDYNLLFHWFVGLRIDDTVWVPTLFTKHRDRLLTTDMSRKIMAELMWWMPPPNGISSRRPLKDTQSTSALLALRALSPILCRTKP